MKPGCAVAAALLALTLAPAQLWADPIAITSGFFSVSGISSNALFEMQGEEFHASGNLEPGVVFPELTCFPCPAGETISLRTEFLGSNGGGTATVNGTAYSGIFVSSTNFIFEAPDIVAPSSGGTFSVTRPFTFSGQLSGWSESPITAHAEDLLFQRALAGEGLLTASFVDIPDAFGPLYNFQSIRYDFQEAAPVPEPATFLLAATGLGAALRLRRRNRRANG